MKKLSILSLILFSSAFISGAEQTTAPLPTDVEPAIKRRIPKQPALRAAPLLPIGVPAHAQVFHMGNGMGAGMAIVMPLNPNGSLVYPIGGFSPPIEGP